MSKQGQPWLTFACKGDVEGGMASKHEKGPPPAYFCMRGRWCECGDVERRWCGHGVIEKWKRNHLWLALACNACEGGGVSVVTLRGGGLGVIWKQNHLWLTFACEGGGVGEVKCHNAKLPSLGSWSPSCRGSSTTQASCGLVLLTRDGSGSCTNSCRSPAPCHDTTCWQLEPVIWGLQHNMSFIWTCVAHQRWVRQLHGL